MAAKATVALALALSAGSARPARAADLDELAPAPPHVSPAAEREARRRYAQGEAAFRAGQYTRALAEFEAGFKAEPRPGFLLNIGHAHRRLGDLRKARAAYNKFLLVDPTSDFHDAVVGLVEEIDRAISDEERAARGKQAVAPLALQAPPQPARAAATPAGLNLKAYPGASDPQHPEASPANESGGSVFRRPWFWIAVGAVAAAGAGVGGYYAFHGGGGSESTIHDSGSLGVLRP